MVKDPYKYSYVPVVISTILGLVIAWFIFLFSSNFETNQIGISSVLFSYLAIITGPSVGFILRRLTRKLTYTPVSVKNAVKLSELKLGEKYYLNCKTVSWYRGLNARNGKHQFKILGLVTDFEEFYPQDVLDYFSTVPE